MIQQILDKMRFEVLKHDRMLVVTRSLIEAWVHHRGNGEYQAFDEMDREMKDLIEIQAEIEWGQGTRVYFNDLTLEVLVINADGRESSISHKKEGA